MRRVIIVIVLLIGFNFISKVFAFDNQRKGFILGVGFGGGLVSEALEINSDWGNHKYDRNNGFGPGTNVQIGYAPTNTLAIYWSSILTWAVLNDATNTENIANSIQGTKIAGLGGLGLSYFLMPDEPSVYLTGEIGYSSRSFPFVEGAKSSYGFGIMGGIGYEIVKHFSIEGNITWGNPREKESWWYYDGDIEYKYNTLTFGLSLKILGY